VNLTSNAIDGNLGKVVLTLTSATDTTPPTAYQGTNPPDNYNSSSKTVTFDIKCSDDIGVDTLQLWANTTGTWKTNYTNSSYTNNTWLNITITGIPNGLNYKWQVYCEDTDGLTNQTQNRTLIIDAPADKKKGGGGGGGSGTSQENQTNLTDTINATNQTYQVNNNLNNNLSDQNNLNNTSENKNETGKFQLKNIIVYAAVLVVIALIIIFIIFRIKFKRVSSVPNIVNSLLV
jgi:hypothetical protein